MYFTGQFPNLLILLRPTKAQLGKCPAKYTEMQQNLPTHLTCFKTNFRITSWMCWKACSTSEAYRTSSRIDYVNTSGDLLIFVFFLRGCLCRVLRRSPYEIPPVSTVLHQVAQPSSLLTNTSVFKNRPSKEARIGYTRKQ